MPEHRIKKSSTTTMHITSGNTPNTIGIGYDSSSTEGKLKTSVDNTSDSTKANFRTVFDSHVGAAAESSNTATSVGVLSQQQSVTGLANAADTTDDVLFTYALPANAFNANGKTVIVEAWGKTATNGNNKQIKLWWGTTTQTVGSAVAGGTAIATSGTVTISNKAWYLYAEITRQASAVQVAYGVVQSDTSVTSPTVTTNLAATDTAAINITLTGASGTSGAASDVVGNSFRVNFAN